MTIFHELPDVQAMETTKTEGYTELLNRHLFAELTVNTGQITLALAEEPNDIAKVEIDENMDEGDGLFVEKDESKALLRIRILTPGNRSKWSIDLSSAEDQLFAQPITPETYAKLEGLVIDPDVAMTNAKTKTEKAI